MKKKLRLLLVVPVLFLVTVLAVAALQLRTGSSADQSAGSVASDDPGSSDTGTETSRRLGGTDETSAERDSGSVGEPALATPMNRAVISTGQVTLHAEAISRARAEIFRLVASWGGTIADEQTTSDDRGRIVDSTLTLRVPSTRFSEAMAAFAGLGKVQQQDRKSEDVTTKVIDNDARVRAAERSIRQIENLLGRAEKLSDVIAIESDLARRQADLDSLKSQQAYLADQTSQSTINVYLSRSGDVRPVAEDARGFLAGLDDGWNAMKGATVVLLTVVGAVLPFLVVVLLLGVPLWVVVRRRLGAGSVSAGSAPARSA